MVLRHPFNSSASAPEQTLALVWRAQARHVGTRTIAQCVAFGAVGVIIPIVLGHATFIALVSLIVAAFGLYAAVVRPSLGGRWLPPRAQHITSIVVSAIAALAAVAAALLVLGAIFGGSIEVMRR
jgi:hypothetical protein